MTATEGRYPSSSATRRVWTRAASATVAGYSTCVHASATSEPQKRTRAAITAATLAARRGYAPPGADMRPARHLEREGERAAGARGGRPEPILLRRLQLQLRPVDAVPVGDDV